MNQEEFDKLLTEAKVKMKKIGVCHKISDHCYVFSYVKDIIAVKAFKDIVAEVNYGLEKHFSSIFFISTVTSKINIKIPGQMANQMARLHTVKSAIWTEKASPEQSIMAVMPLQDVTDLIREKFKSAYMNIIGDMLKSIIFSKQMEENIRQKQYPQSKIIKA